MTRFVARQLSTAHWFRLDAARRDLGYVPRITIEEGLRRLTESLKSTSVGSREQDLACDRVPGLPDGSS